MKLNSQIFCCFFFSRNAHQIQCATPYQLYEWVMCLCLFEWKFVLFIVCWLRLHSHRGSSSNIVAAFHICCICVLIFCYYYYLVVIVLFHSLPNSRSRSRLAELETIRIYYINVEMKRKKKTFQNDNNKQEENMVYYICKY